MRETLTELSERGNLTRGLPGGFCSLVLILVMTGCGPPAIRNISPSLDPTTLDLTSTLALAHSKNEDCSSLWSDLLSRNSVSFKPGPTGRVFYNKGTLCKWWTADVAEAYVCKRIQNEMLPVDMAGTLLKKEIQELAQYNEFHFKLKKTTKNMSMATASTYSSSAAPIIETDFAGVYRLMKLEKVNVRMIVDGKQYQPVAVLPTDPDWSTSTQSTAIPLGGSAIGIATATTDWSGFVRVRFPKYDKGKKVIDENTKEVKLILVTVSGKQHIFTYKTEWDSAKATPRAE